jgi:MerR family transcriptional regulator, mercuric resistance operon regulatory protein
MPAVTESRARPLSIGELSRLSGVNIETIRYYEKIGMVPPPPRSRNGRRVYGPVEKRALSFVRRSRNLGFTLDEIRGLLRIGGPDKAPCGQVREIASLHLKDIRTKIRDLRRLERVLAETIRKCENGRALKCPVIEVLDAGGE